MRLSEIANAAWRFLTYQAQSYENPSTPLIPQTLLYDPMRHETGITVDERGSFGLATVYAIYKIISEDVSSLPFSIYKRTPTGSKEAIDHSLYSLVHDAPNEYMTSSTFRAALLVNALGWGNGYALIRYDGAARIRALDIMLASKTRPKFTPAGKLVYANTQTPDGREQVFPAEDVIHIKGVSLDGITGLSTVGECRAAYELSRAAERFGGQFFGNGARTTGVLQHPGVLGEEGMANLRKYLMDKTSGNMANSPLILEEGMTWQQISISPDDAQFLDTRRFQRSELAGMHRVPLHLLQDLERATNNNVEHSGLDYIRFCLKPWAVRIEQEFDRKIFKPGSGYYTRHDMYDLSRGDFASQTAGFAALRGIGWSLNEIKAKMHENQISAAEGGDVRLAPVNMVPLATLVDENGKPVKPVPPAGGVPAAPDTPRNPAAGKPKASIRPLVRDAVGRIVNRSKYDEEFAYKAIRPIAEFVAGEDGAADLTRKIIADAGSWTKENAAEVATRLTEEIYEATATF